MTFEQILEAERRGELSFQQQAALDELRRRGVIPETAPVEAVAAPQQRTGPVAAVGRGLESLIGTSTTGIQAITGDANEAAELALKRAAVSPYAEQVSWDKVKEVYGTQGALAAAMEVARQVPLAIAEQLPQLAASAGATAAGAKLGALTSPVTGPFGPIIGGGLGFAASTFPGLLGGNIERQAAEQQAAGRPIDVDVGAAALGAAGQTGLEAAGTLIPLGRRAIGALFGPEVKALLDQGKKEAAEALARESLPVVLAKGTAVGVAAEVPTEILQSAIERYQAGLDILSDDALSEYGSAAYQAALVSPIGAAGRVADRSGARAGIEAEKQAQAAREQKAQADKQRQEAQAEEQRRKSPDYILEVADKYESLAKQEDALKAQIKRSTKDAPLSREDADRNAVIQQQLKALKPQLDQARKDYIGLGGPDAVRKARESQLQLTPPPGRVSEPPTAAPVEEVETEDAKRARLTRDERNLAELLQQQRAAMADTTSVEQTLRAATQATQTSQQLAEVQRQLGELPKLPVLEEVEAEIQKRVKPLQKAVKAGDNEKVVTLAQEILALEKQRDAARARQAQMSPDQGLFAPEMVEAETQRREALAGEIARGRETAREEREAGVAEEAEGARRQRTVEREADALRRIGAAEEPVREAAAESRDVRRILQTYGGLRREEQTELFPEGREQVAQTTQAPEGPIRRLQEEIAELEKRRAEKEALPQEELAGALSREPGQIVDIDRRLAALRERLDTLQAGAMERRTVTVPAEGAQVSTRPKEPLQAQIAALAERVLAAPNVDEDTKDVVRQMQADLPAFLRTATRQTVQGAREQRARATGRAPSAAAETLAPQDVASWLYRTLTSGRADTATTAKARDVLRTLEEAKGSETETLPSGEIRRAAQQEFPEMPEPRATAFNTYAEFENYLATAAPTTKDAAGNAVMSVSKLQRELAPIREQAAALRAQEADLKKQAEALKAKTGAERAAAQALLDEAKFTLALTRNALENRIERMLTARALAQQKYSDALTENIRVLMDISEGAKQFEAEIAARDPVRVAGPAGSPQQLGPVGQGFRSATIRQGELAGYDQARAAERAVEKALDAWIAAETNLRDVVQANVGADLSDGSPALNAYLRAYDARQEAKLDVDDAVKDLKRVNAKRKVVTPLSSDAFGDFLVKQAQLADQLEAAQKRVTGFSKALRFHADKADLDAFLKRRDAAQVAFSKALFSLPEGGDVGAVIRNHMKPLEDAKTAMADKLGAYKGTRAQIEAFDKAQADLKAAEALMAEVAVATRPDDAQATQLLAAARTPAVQAGKLESVVQQRLLAARERAEARRRVAPTPPATTLTEREAADAAKRRAEQARLEAGEASGVQILFEKNKEDLLADTNYIALVEKAYNRSLPNAERMAAAQDADKYLQDKIASREKKGEKRSAASALHEENLRGAKAKLADLRAKEGKTKTEKQAAKLKAAIAEAQRKVDFHQDKLNKSLTGTGIERVTRGDLAKLRELVHEEVRSPTQERAEAEEAVARTRVAGERLGVAEGTQQRAIGPATRPEVMAPKTLRTGSAESVAGETTTPSKNRIQEARGVRQRDVPLTSVESAEANVDAARINLERAQNAKSLREAIAQKDKVEASIAEKGASPYRNRMLKVAKALVAKKELPVQIAEKVLEERQIALEIAREGSTVAREKARTKAQAETAALVRQLEALTAEETRAKRAASAKKVRSMRAVRLSDDTSFDDTVESESLGGAREDVFFSRGATANPSTVDSVRAELKKAFPDLGRVQIYDSVDALVKANPQYEGRIPDNARGFVDSAGNKAFLIAENIDQGRALGVLLHEVGAHIGLKNMLGDAQYNALVKAVETWAKKDDGSVESRVAKAAQARVEAAETPASQRRDETLAYAIEEALNAGVKPMETKGPLGQWLGRIAQLFRRALEKFGLPPKALDAQGLVDMAFGAAKMEMRGKPAGPVETAPGDILFSKAPKYAPSLSEAGKVADKLIAPQRSFMGKLKANLLGFRVQVVDRLDPFVKAFERGVSAGLLSDLKATQAMYYLRMQGQQMHFTSQAISDGAPMLVEKRRKDGATEYVIESKADGANIKKVVDILSRKEVAKEAGSPDAANRLLTLYMGAIRAENKGFDKLNFGRAAAERELVQLRNELKSDTLKPNERARVTRRIEKLTANMDRLPSEQEIRAAKAAVEANPTLKKAFDEARDIYNAYNRDLIAFAAETGTIAKDEAARLLRDNDYIPYYRERGGVAELVIGSETPMRIGNLKDSPHLVELMGDQEPIFDFLTSSVQNTSMLIDMSMHNLAVKNAMWELASAGLARNYRVQTEKGKRRDIPEGAVRFRVKGEDWYSVVDTDTIGVPSELLVKGLAGIPTMFPAMVQILGMPARLLRRLIVASPIYAARQLFRDSLAASIASGANTVPVLSALKQIRRKSALDARGVAGGQVFTGMPEDMTRLLREMQSGRPGWAKAFSKLEAMSMEADAATRRAQYDSYIEQGLSEMEATYMALESMNFTKRGVSPTIHMLSTLVPFFNAQIQGLDVLYKSFTGKMPFNERLKVREKLIKRGALMFGMSLVYAAAMQDDEEYKNATPDQKYGNWFVRMPFLDEMAGERVTVRVPIPFELGYIFKALPEALYNTVATEEGGKESLKALNRILINTVPGGSNMPTFDLAGVDVPAPFPIPAAVKPLIELSLGKSFFTGRDLETAREQDVQPFARYREQTSEAAKAVGSMFNVSPIKLEALISGYTGSLGLALLQTLNFAVPDTGPESATKRLSQLSLVGTLFQPSDAQGIIDAAYERMNEVRQVQRTYEALLKESPERAAKYAQDKINEMSLAAAEGNFRQQLGKLTTYERQVRAAPTLTAQEKRERLDQLRQAKIRVASQARALLDRRAPQAAPA